MMKKLISLLLALLLPVISLAEEAADYEPERLRVGSPTPLTGSFLGSVFDCTTSDMDVQDLIHGYSIVRWDPNGARFRFDRSVVEDTVVMNRSNGDREYLVVLYDDLYYSDGTRITAWDYAFSLLLSVDPVIKAIGGRNTNIDWLVGAEAYESGKPLKGLRVLSDQMLEFTASAESLPYFYELSRMAIQPWPAHIIAPGTKVKDDGEGAYLETVPDPEELKAALLDPENGYVSHPSVVSGPYILTGFDGTTAEFAVNTHFKGNEQGILPKIEKLSYTLVDNETVTDEMRGDKLDLVNKISEAEAITGGMNLVMGNIEKFSLENYARDGQTLIWFCEDSEMVQDLVVRQAIAYCLDRKGFTSEYTGNFGIVTDGLYGVGTWMYLLTEGTLHYRQNNASDGEAEPEEIEFSLEGMTTYDVDLDTAGKILNKAGWNKNGNGKDFVAGKHPVRYKKVNGEMVGLTLTMAVPDSDKVVSAMKKHFIQNLSQVGIDVQLVRLSMKDLARAYMDGSGYDMIYIGDNFSVIFNIYFVQPTVDPATVDSKASVESSLTLAREELYEMALDMVHTENADIAAFENKWIALQKRISETLTVLPVYSNVYFDFYERELHGYDVFGASSWADAIIPAYFSELEELTEEEELSVRERIQRFEQ